MPISSLFRQNELWSVFKVVAGSATIQSVKVGRRNDRFAEITQGLNLQEQIITHPSNAIEERVTVSQR